MSDTQKKLARAFKLIKRDKTDKALEILRPIVDAEPENVHAWWLLAYAVTEPHEVREALITVLRLDPNYDNAPKAREMLEKLNHEYPPTPEEVMRYPELQSTFPDAFADHDLFGEDAFALDTSFGEIEADQPFSEDPFDDIFGESEFVPVAEDIFASEDPFAEMQEDPFAADKTIAAQAAEPTREDAIGFDVLELEEEALDEETLAAREERAGRRRGRGKRLRFYLIVLLIIVVGVAALGYLGSSLEDDESEAADPGELQNMVEVAIGDPDLARLGDGSRAVRTESKLGETLYIQICAKPAPNVPELIQVGVVIATRQALLLEDGFQAVGVTVESCAEDYDTLYRAIVTLDDALRYQNGEIDWAEFQTSWQTP